MKKNISAREKRSNTSASVSRQDALLNPRGEKNFFQSVYEVVRCIPPGYVTSYGAIARYLGTGRSARMVGWAMNSSHNQREYVPAHRVVNRNGILTGKHHFGGPEIMAQLLEAEGLKISKDRVVDFKKHFWDPSIHLKA